MSQDDDKRQQALAAMDIVVQGLQTGMWGITAGYINHPQIAAAIVEGFVRLYLNSLHVYHDADTCAMYAVRLAEVVDPFTTSVHEVDEDDWADALTTPLLDGWKKSSTPT